MEGKRGDCKGTRPGIHRLGTACGQKGPPPCGEVRQRKAPRVQRNASFFAEGCARRPCSRRSESASPGAEHRVSGGSPGGSECIEPATPAGQITGPRHEVSEPIGLGQSSRLRASAARGAGDRRREPTNQKQQPLTRDHSTSPLRKETASRPPYPRSARKRRVRIADGFRRSLVVLVDRFDCRSRRAARGDVRSRAKSSRKRCGLALPHRSEGRKSVGSRPRVAKSAARWRVRVRGVRESGR
jgi:hypothetical protein